MKRPSVLTVLLALLAAHATAQAAEAVHVDAAAAGDAGIAPFSAQFQADWKGITVGTSNIALEGGSRTRPLCVHLDHHGSRHLPSGLQ